MRSYDRLNDPFPISCAGIQDPGLHPQDLKLAFALGMEGGGMRTDKEVFIKMILFNKFGLVKLNF